MTIEVIEDADDDVKQSLIAHVRGFNAAEIGDGDSKPLTVVARDVEGELSAASPAARSTATT